MGPRMGGHAWGATHGASPRAGDLCGPWGLASATQRQGMFCGLEPKQITDGASGRSWPKFVYPQNNISVLLIALAVQ